MTAEEVSAVAGVVVPVLVVALKAFLAWRRAGEEACLAVIAAELDGRDLGLHGPEKKARAVASARRAVPRGVFAPSDKQLSKMIERRVSRVKETIHG